MKKLRVLLTNNTLASRAGTECYIKDIALELLERGHNPIAYSSDLGDVANELRQLTIPVISDLDQISEPPDIIHGHHHLDTISALLKFPSVPAVYVCHGWLPWQEDPPIFPRIHSYIAVDDLCQERLISEAGIPKERVKVIYNFADKERFQQRSPLPEKPLRALLYSNGASPDIIREACSAHNIRLDCVGGSFGVTERPEEMLYKYDIVFAKARAAIEALVTGCAVILYDVSGTGGLVTTENLEHYRSLNFGVRCLQRNVSTLEFISQEISKYSAEDSEKITNIMRQEADFSKAFAGIFETYKQVIELHKNYVVDLKAESIAVSKYFSRLRLHIRDLISSYRKQIDIENWHHNSLNSLADSLRKGIKDCEDRLIDRDNAINILNSQNASLKQQLENETNSLNETIVQFNILRDINNDLRKQTERIPELLSENDSLKLKCIELENRINTIENSKTIMLRNKLMRLVPKLSQPMCARVVEK